MSKNTTVQEHEPNNMKIFTQKTDNDLHIVLDTCLNLTHIRYLRF